MKYFYTLLVFAFCSATSQAQFVDLYGEINTALGSTSVLNEEISVSWDVINISGSSREISCRREMIQEVAGSTGRFCWGEVCSPPTSGNYVLTGTVIMNDGDTSNTFRGYYRHNGNPGQSIARFCWFDAAAPVNSVCYDVNFCVDQACIVGVEELENKAQLAILGNPASSLSGISYSFATHPSQAELLIYSATGMLVANHNLASAQGVVLIDANQMANGIYTCKLNENGRTVGIQRMVVSK